MKKNLLLQKSYDRIYKKGEKKHFTYFLIKKTPTREADEVLKEISWKGKEVLDVGCGTGDFSYKIAKKGANVLGIDFSKEAIRIAANKHKHPCLRFESLDAMKIVGKYNVIVSLGTLEHMDEPFKMLKLFKKHLKSKGRIIITNPNWTNPRGYVLMTLWHLFRAPITLYDLHYLTPIDHIRWAKKLNMNLKWRTIERSWSHGDIMIKDFVRRIPNVLRDAHLPIKSENINNLIKWLEENVVTFENSLPHSGAVGIYMYKK